MEAVLGHWDTWEDDAIVLDVERYLSYYFSPNTHLAGERWACSVGR
jgi:hypothetical protein